MSAWVSWPSRKELVLDPMMASATSSAMPEDLEESMRR